MSKKMGIIQRLLLASPDAITSATMLAAWIAPTAFGPEWVLNLALTVVIECFVVLLSVFYAIEKANPEESRSKRLVPFIMFAVVFALFIAFFSIFFHTAWPLVAYGWLCGSRFVSLWTHPDFTNQEDRMLLLWLLSPLLYLVGSFILVLGPPPPSLGVTPAFIASMDRLESIELLARPYYELAFGFVYFGVVALFKFLVISKNTDPDVKIYRRDDLDLPSVNIRDHDAVETVE